MGFMDKAKKMAEQAQTKLDEVQKQFNEGQKGAPGGQQQPAQEYDQHGRPVGPGAGGAESSTPPHGDPVAEPTPPPAPPAPPPAAPTPDPAAPKEEDPYTPPKLSGGDPLAG